VLLNIFFSPAVARIIFITAVVNLGLVLTIMLSCRWVPVARLTKSWMNRPAFKRLYKYHTYLWWWLLASIIVHAVFAIGRVGIPFR
jgi:hypothetical protein